MLSTSNKEDGATALKQKMSLGRFSLLQRMWGVVQRQATRGRQCGRRNAYIYTGEVEGGRGGGHRAENAIAMRRATRQSTLNRGEVGIKKFG